MNKMFLLFSFVFFLTACSKDKENNDPIKNSIVINTDEGSSFKVLFAGSSETISGTSVILGNGSLLNQAFFRQFNISTTKGSLAIRLNFPSSMIGKVDENMYAEHALGEYRLPLQESGSITEVYAEAYFPSSGFFYDDNSTGTIKLQKNVTVGGVVLGLFGEAKLIVEGQDGKMYIVEGYFWKK